MENKLQLIVKLLNWCGQLISWSKKNVEKYEIKLLQVLNVKFYSTFNAGSVLSLFLGETIDLPTYTLYLADQPLGQNLDYEEEDVMVVLVMTTTTNMMVMVKMMAVDAIGCDVQMGRGWKEELNWIYSRNIIYNSSNKHVQLVLKIHQNLNI